MTGSRATRMRRVAGGVIASAAVAFTTALLPTATAAAQPLDPAASPVTIQASCHVGQVPIVLANTWVRQGPGLGSPSLYTLTVGAGYRITAGPIDNDGIRWWKGHGNGLADGWTPEYNLSCR
ncbi:hypothetical protein [Saccharothrix xinjiangensis]|uniref:SH3 domain-containing protein n=1 Tax=Saccharothrix xinjiangensis TaxID=204798 RepID=A0ABV9Y730_9PSEU